MSIKITCQACQRTLTAPEKYAGRKAKCKCGQALVIPMPENVAEPLDPLQALPEFPERGMADLPPVESDPVSQAPPPVFAKQKSAGSEVTRKQKEAAQLKKMVGGTKRIYEEEQEEEPEAFYQILFGGPLYGFIGFAIGVVILCIGLALSTDLGGVDNPADRLYARMTLYALIWGAVFLVAGLVGFVIGSIDPRKRFKNGKPAYLVMVSSIPILLMITAVIANGLFGKRKPPVARIDKEAPKVSQSLKAEKDSAKENGKQSNENDDSPSDAKGTSNSTNPDIPNGAESESQAEADSSGSENDSKGPVGPPVGIPPSRDNFVHGQVILQPTFPGSPVRVFGGAAWDVATMQQLWKPKQGFIRGLRGIVVLRTGVTCSARLTMKRCQATICSWVSLCLI